MNEIRCPNCGSENVQSCQMIYMNGTNDSSHVTMHGLADSFSVTQGQTQTQLAQSVAPPSPKKTYWIWFSLFFAGAVLNTLAGMTFGVTNAFISSLFPIAMCIWLFRKNRNNSNWNKYEYPKIYQQWQNSFVCHRCGTIFGI